MNSNTMVIIYSGAILFLVVSLFILAGWGDVVARRLQRLRHDRGRYVTLRSGTRWYPRAPRASDVDLRDLNALAWINRFGGHAGLATVAEHSVRVAQRLVAHGLPAWVCLQGLLHDGAEVYPPGDQLAPVLHDSWWLTWQFRRMKRRAEDAFRDRLALPRRLHDAVAAADREEFHREFRSRMPCENPLPPYSQPSPWEPDYAMWRFWLLAARLASDAAAEFRKSAKHVPWALDVRRVGVLEALAQVATAEASRLDPHAGRGVA